MTYRLRDEDLTWQVIDGEIVALDLRSSEYIRLNRTGTLLWELMDARAATEGELVTALACEFDVDLPQATEDVKAFLARLGQQNLLASS